MQAAAQQAKTAVEAVQQAQPAVNEELKRALLDFTKSTLEAVKDSAHSTVDFAKEQVPLVLQEIVRAQVLSAVMFVVGALLMLALVNYVSRHLWSYAMKPETDSSDRDVCIGLSWASFIFGNVLGSVLVLVNTYDALYAYWFPRLTILEYLANLAKQVSS